MRRAFLQDKLWRDKAVEAMESMGSIIHWQRLDDAGFAQALQKKLLEEAEEVVRAEDRKELMGELVDVLDIVDSICDLHQISREEMAELQNKKNQERGGFAERKYVTVAEHLPGSFGEQYCLNDPEKYPELFKQEESTI